MGPRLSLAAPSHSPVHHSLNPCNIRPPVPQFRRRESSENFIWQASLQSIFCGGYVKTRVSPAHQKASNQKSRRTSKQARRRGRQTRQADEAGRRGRQAGGQAGRQAARKTKGWADNVSKQGRGVVPGSTDKDQQNGRRSTKSGITETCKNPPSPRLRIIGPAKNEKPKTRKQPELREGRHLGACSKSRKTQKNTPGGSPQNKKTLKHLLRQFALRGVVSEGSGAKATQGLCKNQMRHHRTNIIITLPPPPR